MNRNRNQKLSARKNTKNSKNSKEAYLILDANGADVNSSDAKGRTALVLAAAAGNHDAVKVLLESGADRNPRDQGRMTAADDGGEIRSGKGGNTAEKGAMNSILTKRYIELAMRRVYKTVNEAK